MIFGVGIDQIEVRRVAKSILNDRFLTNTFTDIEIEYCNKFKRKEEHFDARFAAKEAFLKAFGTGLSNGFSLNEIGVVNNELGKPELLFYGKSSSIVSEFGLTKCHISLTHLKEIACAIVVLEK